MSDSKIQQNLLPNDPELKDLLNLFRKSLLLDLNCHHIGKIQVFNPLNQTATVTINYKKTFFVADNGAYVPKLVDYPILAECPVICLGGGNGALTFPISAGDDCLVLFNDRDLDNWFQGSSSSGVATPRLHAFSDGIVLVGLRSRNDVLVDYDTDGTTLRTVDGLTKIKIASDGSNITTTVGPAMEMVITADGTVSITNGVDELISALIKLYQDIQSATTMTLLGPQPLVMPTFAADLIKLQTFQEV